MTQLTSSDQTKHSCVVLTAVCTPAVAAAVATVHDVVAPRNLRDSALLICLETVQHNLPCYTDLHTVQKFVDVRPLVS